MLYERYLRRHEVWSIVQNAAPSTLTARLIVLTAVRPFPELKTGLTQGMNGEDIMRNNTATAIEETALDCLLLVYLSLFLA